MYGCVGAGTDNMEDQKYAVFLHQLSRLLQSLGRAVRIVIGDSLDLPSADPAFGIQHVDIGLICLGDLRIGCCRPGEGRDKTDLDRRVGHAGILRPSALYGSRC